MEAIIGAVAEGVMNCLCSSNAATRSVIEQCTYILSPTKEIFTLRKKMADLNGQVADVSKILDIAESEVGRLRRNDVKSWLKDVENVNIEMNGIEDKVQRAKGCLKGLLPDCCSRSDMGHCISKLTIEVIVLLEKSRQFLDNPLSLTLPMVNKGMKIPTTRLVGKITAEENMMSVWERLLDPKVGKIGLYGMGGAGKTTIMKEVNNRLLEEHHFDNVIWVTVSKDASVEKLQSYIADAIKRELPENYDNVHRSALLLASLERKKKFVLILDDIWTTFPIHTIGIPEPTEQNGCKIILTSRSKEVCRRMGCHDNNIIKVKLLSEDEAWELFMDKVDVDLTAEIMEIAKDVVKECASLPLAIITIGGAMKGNNDISEWRVTRRNLKESSYEITEMGRDVFKCLKFSYEQLDGDKLKRCFLYCSLYPEDYMIETKELVEYWIVEDLIQENNRQCELDQGQIILNKLIHRCLLETVVYNSIEHVKLHDLLREMALDIVKDHFIVKAGTRFEEIQTEEEWGEDLERASFMNSKVTKISVTPKCPKLSTLFLDQMNKLYSMPPDFFVHMKGLRVLNMGYNWELETLPGSISDLMNLRSLCLNGCSKLRDVPSLSKLASLRTLKLDDSGVEEVPHGMENLISLKCLSWNNCNLRGRLPNGLISKLTRLEELHLLGYTSCLYEVGGGRGIVDELLRLKHLEILCIYFVSWSHFISYVGSPTFKGLNMFYLAVGDNYFGRGPLVSRNTLLQPMSDDEIDDIPVNALIFPQNTEALGLSEFKNLTSLNQLSTRLNQLGCLELRQCRIWSCQNLEYMLSFSQKEKEEGGIVPVLPRLEKLYISWCSKLQSLCKGIPTPGTLLYLKMLDINQCDNMKNVFSSSTLLQLLQHLEEIVVDNCDEIEELIASEEEEKGITCAITISLPKLRILRLSELPKLKSIWKGGMVCDSLQLLHIFKCDELKKLPRLIAPSLQRFWGSSQGWWDSLEWDADDDDHPSLAQRLLPLFRHY